VSERPQEWSREEVVALLQQVDLFEGLPDDDLNAIAAIVGGRTIEPREALFEEGEPGDAFYIVFGARSRFRRRARMGPKRSSRSAAKGTASVRWRF
jgi:hypothetical protein